MIGTRIGAYTLVAKLGSGGMGAVYRAHQASLNRDVAIKILHPGQTPDPAQLERFRREAQLLAQVTHPHIIQILEAGFDQGQQPYIVMEFVDGHTVGRLIKDHGPLGELDAVRIASQVASGLGAAHAKKFVHRDVKPSNILVAPGPTAKLGDFGVAAFLDQPDEERLTMTRAAVGTPHYMSPEQIKARDALTGASDVYSLGVVLYEMLAGKHPFGDATPGEAMIRQVGEPFPPIRRFRNDVSDDVERVLNRCLAKDRAERFQDGQALHEALEKVRARLEVAQLAGGPATEDYRARVTGTGFFYVDPSLGKKGLLAAGLALGREMWAQTVDPHKRSRRRMVALYARAQAARERYKTLEKNHDELKKRKAYHETAAGGYKEQIERCIAEGKADEAEILAAKEARSRARAVEYEHQVAELSKDVGRLRESYDGLRDQHAAAADELSLQDAETQRRGGRIPSWHVNARLAHRARLLGLGLCGIGVGALVAAGWGFWVWIFQDHPRPSVEAAAAPASPPAAEHNLAGLVAHWPLNGNASDVSGNGLHGMIIGNVVLAPDRFMTADAAYLFPGAPAQIRVENYSSLQMATNAFSISVWLSTKATGTSCLIQKGSVESGRGYSLSVVNGCVAAKIAGSGGGTEIVGTTPVNDGQWHHVVLTVDRQADGMIYVDGKRDAKADLTAECRGSLSNSSFFNISGFFRGCLDDIRVYHRTLNPAEVDVLYRTPRPPPTSSSRGESKSLKDAVAVWPLDGNAEDASGNGHSGKVYHAVPAPDRFNRADRAFQFNGTDASIDVGELNLQLPLTVTLWFCSSNANPHFRTLLSWNATSVPYNGVQIATHGDQTVRGRIGTQNNDAISNSHIDGDGQWHLVAITRGTDDQLKLYVDGRLERTVSMPDPIGTSHRFYIGKSFRPRDEFFQGRIDDVRIYQRVWNDQEIEALYLASAGS